LKQDSKELFSAVNAYKREKKVKNQEPLSVSKQDMIVSAVNNEKVDAAGCSDECYATSTFAFVLCYDEDNTEDEFVACVETLIPPGSDCYASLPACACWFVYYNTGKWVCSSNNSLKQDSQELSSAVKVYKREKKVKNQEPLRVSKQDMEVSAVNNEKVDDAGCSDECYATSTFAFVLCYDEDITEDDFVACVETLIPPGSDCYASLPACTCWFVYYNTGKWVCNSKISSGASLKQDSQSRFSVKILSQDSAVKIYKKEKKVKNQ